MRKNKHGFTLVELLAVIVILAIILVIAVPKVMSIIEDSKKATLESTAKMIASQAEKAFVQNTILDKQKEIECADVVKINSADYEKCIIEFDNKGKAKVTIKGSGKFDNLNICAGDKTSSTASDNACEVEYTKASTYIEKLEAFTDDNGLITDTSPDKNIRYAGANPNNKVYFNCKDKDANAVAYGETNYDYVSSCEVWRIIGVFDTKTSVSDTEGAKRVKLVRDAFSVNMSWDSSAAGDSGTDNNSGYGINEWSQADLQVMLNGYYIGKEGETCTYCNAENQGTCDNNCSSSVTPLSSSSVNMIDRVLWNTGAQDWSDPMTVTAMYSAERGTQNGKTCLPTTLFNGLSVCTDSVIRTTTWEGLVGLIYPSDYGYASTDTGCASDIVKENSTCDINNWLHPSSGYYWTISPRAYFEFATNVWVVSSDIHVDSGGVRNAYGVRPAAYLDSDVQIIGGDGNTIPFKLAM